MLKVIDNHFDLLGAIDNYQSYIPERSYFAIGTFELHLKFSEEYAKILVEENIIFMTPDKPYIILHSEINQDDNSMVIKGEELKQYISRWITKPPFGKAYHRLNAPAETIMKTYVVQNCKIPNLVVAPDLSRGSVIVFQTRYKQLDQELTKIGLTTGLGWIVKLDLDNKQFVFDVIQGIDRTAGQDINSRAIFSTSFDNVAGQSLIQSKMGYKNVAIVAGQGEGESREIREVGNATGFDRYEVFIDAKDVENVADLADRGFQKLAELERVESFESEILTNSNLVYQSDYNLGDTVTIQNKKWNVTLDTIIESITEIYEVNGFRLDATFGNTLPTFTEMLKKKLDTPIVENGGALDYRDLNSGYSDTVYDTTVDLGMAAYFPGTILEGGNALGD